jgi:hypothetical protein
MYVVIALFPIPFALSRLKMICVLWLEASMLDKCATVGPVNPVRAILFEKNCLDRMISLIAGALNPDSLCLVYGWDGHGFPPI